MFKQYYWLHVFSHTFSLTCISKKYKQRYWVAKRKEKNCQSRLRTKARRETREREWDFERLIDKKGEEESSGVDNPQRWERKNCDLTRPQAKTLAQRAKAKNKNEKVERKDWSCERKLGLLTHPGRSTVGNLSCVSEGYSLYLGCIPHVSEPYWNFFKNKNPFSFHLIFS